MIKIKLYYRFFLTGTPPVAPSSVVSSFSVFSARRLLKLYPFIPSSLSTASCLPLLPCSCHPVPQGCCCHLVPHAHTPQEYSFFFFFFLLSTGSLPPCPLVRFMRPQSHWLLFLFPAGFAVIVIASVCSWHHCRELLLTSLSGSNCLHLEPFVHSQMYAV